MNINLAQLIRSHLPAKTRTNSQGWILFNAQCCHHRGHKPDTKMRGNIMFADSGEIGHNCYNCGFKFRFDGAHLSQNFVQWLSWIGVDHQQIQAVKMQLLSAEIDGSNTTQSRSLEWHNRWPSVPLPAQAQPLDTLLQSAEQDPSVLKVLNYLASRGRDIALGYNYYWSNSKEHQLQDRVILPFLHKSTIVGWTARYAGAVPPGVSRYWNSSVPPGYVFNHDVLLRDRKFVFVTEGPFDAIAVQGVSALGSTMSDLQIETLLHSNQEPIVLPDRQARNQQLIDVALAFGWSVSFPEWQDHIKDAADACNSYGQIYTITSALAAKTNNPIEIGIKRKMFKG